MAVTDALTQEIRALLRAGLPVRLDGCGKHLLALAGVKSRAADPDDQASRVQALNSLLRAQLGELENAELAAAAPLLFGAVAATSGTTLSDRRQAAAQASGYEVHHFRKRIEPKLAQLVAWQLHRDSERFATRYARPPELRVEGGPLTLPTDVFAWEAAEHQSALAALWGTVYLLRAELLDVAALLSMGTDDSTLDGAAAIALWRRAQVLRAVSRYQSRYGDRLLRATVDLGAPFGPTQIAASAGWTPELTPAQELLLIECADRDGSRADFSEALAAADGGMRLDADWRQGLTRRTGRRAPLEEEERSL